MNRNNKHVSLNDDQDWFFNAFDKNVETVLKRGTKMVILVWLLGLLGILAVIAAVVLALVILL